MSEQTRMDELFLRFTDANWAGMDRDQKLATLQEMENLLAAEQGRPPMEVRVLTDEMLREGGWANCAGGFDGRALWLNPGYFEESTGVIPGLEQWTGFDALNTLIHEGRHCWQHYVADHPEVPVDPKLRALLRMNFSMYISPELGDALYGCQPVELDARRYAKDLIANLAIRAFENGNGDESMLRQHQNDLNVEAMYAQTVMDELSVDELLALDEYFRVSMLFLNPDCDLDGVSMFGEVIEMMNCQDPMECLAYLDGTPLALPGARDRVDEPQEILDAMQLELLDQLKGMPPVREPSDRPAIGMN